MSIRYRFAQQSDSMLVFNWRNEESIRISSRNQALISVDQHDIWFAARVKNFQSEPILIFSTEFFDVGYTRLDSLDAYREKVEVSIAVTSNFQNMGIGSLMLDETVKIARNVLRYGEICATVRENNYKSLKLFLSSGFRIFEKDANFVNLKMTL